MISIIIPIVRPEKAELCIAAIKEHATMPYELVTAVDEKRIGCPRMVDDLTKKTKFDWVMFLGDDTIPEPHFLENAFATTGELPDMWGMVGLNDGHHNGERLATHWLCHKNMLDLTGGTFFHTGYHHLFCDNELTDIAKENGRYVWAENAKIIHNNPRITDEKKDEFFDTIYDKEKNKADHRLYLKRKEDRIGYELGVGFPCTNDMLHSYFFFSMMLMDIPSHNLYYPKQFYHPSSLPQCRNEMARSALRDGCTHLIMMDTDQVYHEQDLIRRLLSHKKDIVGAKVHRRWPPFEPILNRWKEGKVQHVPDEEINEGGLVKVDATGTGCLMIRTSVFLDMPYPWFKFEVDDQEHVTMGEDIYFCKGAGKAGYEVYVDCDAQIGHLAQFHVDTPMYQLFKKLNKVA